MKSFVRVFTLVLCSLAVTAAMATPRECKEPPGQQKDRSKPTKVTILHCGCPEVAGDMVYVEIQVSSKSKGHLHHASGGFASCPDDSGTDIDYVRTGSDCQVRIDDDTQQLDGLDFCDEFDPEKLPGDSCGSVNSG